MHNPAVPWQRARSQRSRFLTVTAGSRADGWNSPLTRLNDDAVVYRAINSSLGLGLGRPDKEIIGYGEDKGIADWMSRLMVRVEKLEFFGRLRWKILDWVFFCFYEFCTRIAGAGMGDAYLVIVSCGLNICCANS